MSAQVMCEDVYAVVVTFNPDLPALDSLIAQLLAQVGGVIVVDNGSARDLSRWCAERANPRLRVHLAGENLGIAAAQNIGLAEARRSGARYALLSDQDSRPAPDMVLRLRQAAATLESQPSKLAAVGPSYSDPRYNHPPFGRMKGLRVEWVRCRDADCVVEVDYLIASGSLIPLETLQAVGPMKEELFIDYVDVEWAMRARRLGYLSYGICAASMEHAHGDSAIVFMGRHYLSHSPSRHYYRVRNAIWLYKQNYVPANWKIADAIGLARRYVFYSFFAKPRTEHWRMMTIGLLHGFKSRLGRVCNRVARDVDCPDSQAAPGRD